jgi:hypothetical protein
MRTYLAVTAAFLLAAAGRVGADEAVGIDGLDTVFGNFDRDGEPGWKHPSIHNVLTDRERKAGFQLLFNGANLDGWKAAENPGSFVVREGELIAGGPRGHLFYVGSVSSAVFTNFHLKLEVMTGPKANSGVYFHTEYQEQGWPKKGYEAQVNNSGKDGHKTGVLYGTGGNKPPATDGRWFLYEIIVEDKRVQLKVDGATTTTYTEPEDVDFPKWPGRRLSQGTFALQAHDPRSKVHYRTIRVRPLSQE